MPHRNRIFVNHVLEAGDLDIYEHIGWDNDKNSRDFTPMSSRSHLELRTENSSADLSEEDVKKLIEVLENYLDLFKHKGEKCQTTRV